MAFGQRILPTASFMALGLAACSGGGSHVTTAAPTAAAHRAHAAAAQPTAAAAPVSVRTGAGLNEFAQVWLELTKITVRSGAGGENVIFQSATPLVCDVASPTAVRRCASTLSLPSGSVAEVRMTVANAIQLVTPEGKTIQARLNEAGAPVTIPLHGNLNGEGQLPLLVALNLSQYTYDSGRSLVLAMNEQRNFEALQGMTARAPSR